MSVFENYPIILIPGIARFDYFRSRFIDRLNELLEPEVDSDFTHYFKGIRTYLQNKGYKIEYGDVAFADGLEKRSEELARSIEETLAKYNQPKVHLLGHSMGGIDARYLAANNPDAAQKVVTVTTLGTPHLGISLAEIILERGANDLIKFAKELDLDFTGFQTLTRAAMRDFNENNRHAEATNDIIYTTYSAWQERKDVFSPLRISWDLIDKEEGKNDGLVSAISQAWVSEIVADNGERKPINQREFPLRIDHLNQTGRWDLAEWDWAHPNIIKQIRRFEQQVKDGYLKMVQDITALA